jgi:hypothetical protein
MPVDLRHMIQGRQNANNIINDAITQRVQGNPDDVDDINPRRLMRNIQDPTELERIYDNIRTSLGQPQGPQEPPQGPQEPPQGPQEPPRQLREEGVSIEPDLGTSGGKVRKTSNKKRPTARRRRSSKARKSRTTRRK